MSYHPEFAKYTWEKIKAKITAPTIQLKGHPIPLSRVMPQVVQSIKNKLFSNDVLSDKFHMNPIAYHIRNNKYVENFITEYYKLSIELLNDQELRKDIEKLIHEGTAVEKVMMLSLLSAIKRFVLV